MSTGILFDKPRKIALAVILLVILLFAAASYVSVVVSEACQEVYQMEIYKFFNSSSSGFYALAAFIILICLIVFFSGQPRWFIAVSLAILVFVALMTFLASLNTARYKSRDARRITDIKQLQLALELYFDKHANKYPDTLEELASNKFIPVVPRDPLPDKNYDYRVRPDKVSYVLRAELGDDCRSRVAQYEKLQRGEYGDLDGEVLGLNCDHLAYCVKP